MAEPTSFTGPDGKIYDLVPEAPAAPKAPVNRGFGERLGDAYRDSVQYGTSGWIARKVMDWTDQGKDLYRQKYPTMSEEELEKKADELVIQAQRDLRAEGQRKQAEDPNWRADESFVEATMKGRWAPWFIGQMGGSVGPESLIAPGSSAAARIGAQSGVNAAADAFYQKNDIDDGVSDNYDANQTLLAGATGGVGQGVLEGIAKLRGIVPGGEAVDDVVNTPSRQAPIDPAVVDDYIKNNPDFTVADLRRMKVANAEEIVALRDKQKKAGQPITISKAVVQDPEGVTPQAAVKAPDEAPMTPDGPSTAVVEEPEIVVTAKKPFEVNRDAGDGSTFYDYTTTNGKVIPVRMAIDDGIATIDANKFADKDKNTLGAAEMRNATYDLINQFPEITEIGGFRRSGAGAGREQIITVTDKLRAAAAKYDEVKNPKAPVEEVVEEITPSVREDLEVEEPDPWAGSINLKKLGTDEEQSAYIKDAAYDLKLDPVTHAETIGKANDILKRKSISDIINYDPKLSEASEYALANRTLLVGATKKIQEAAAAVIDPAARSDYSDAAMNELRVILAASAYRADGNASKAGRLLNQYKIGVGDNTEGLSRALKSLNNLDTKAFAEQVRNFSNNPDALQQLSKDSLKPYFEDYLTSIRYTMMLSGLGTHVKNALGNSLMFGADLAEDAGASLLGQAKRFGKNKNDRVFGREVLARAYGAARALVDGKTYADTFDALKSGTPTNKVSKIEDAQNSILPLSGATEFPRHLLAASDQFFRGIIENSAIYGQAVSRSIREGHKGDRLWERVDELIRNPTPGMQRQAADQAAVTQLVSDPSDFVQWIEKGKARHPNMTAGQRLRRFTLQMVMPFSRVTDNLVFANIRRSPLGFLDRINREDWKAGGARRDKVKARIGMGSALAGYLAIQAYNGNLTGAGPKDYRKLQELEAGGWQKNSMKIGDQYISLAGADAMSINASLIASAVEKWKQGELDDEDYLEQAKTVAHSMANSLADNTFAGQAGDFLAIFGGGPMSDSALENYVASTAASYVVPAAARQANNIIDPVVRDTTGDGGMMDRIEGRVKSGLPGLSDDLPQKMDVYGRPVEKSNSVISKVLGIGVNRKADSDPVVQELQRLSTEKSPLVGPPGKSIKVDGERRRLEAAEFQVYQQLSGYWIHAVVKEQMASPEWKEMSDEDRVKTVKQINKDMRAAARDTLFGSGEDGETPTPTDDATESEPQAQEQPEEEAPVRSSNDVASLLEEEFGVTITDSGPRSSETQQYLAANFSGVAAPGTSRHENDKAVDIAVPDDLYEDDIIELLESKGLKNVRIVTRPHGSGPHWHIQWD